MFKPIQIFFSKLFPKLILKNKLVATVVYNISAKLAEVKDKIDLQTNTDI